MLTTDAPGFSFLEASVTLRTPSFSVRRVDRLLLSEKPMKLASFEAIATALDDAGVRYLVAGGLAVNAHGYLRFTKDVDIVVQLVPANVLRAFAALHAIGFRPSVPVTAAEFADPGIRNGWIRDKGMQVLQFWSDAHLETPVDMFVTEPFDFDEEYSRALIKPLHDQIEVRFVSAATLIRMKSAVGRPQDQLDVENLRIIENDDDR